MSQVSNYAVHGMTCAHCVSSVSDEIRRIEGVTGVDVDLGSGVVHVVSVGPLGAEAVRKAVEEAGYELAR
ncbi:MAG: copper chaperone [Actinomycetia bacterium]|nr:copper chaperone [Actinomycetes bacterium]